MHGSCLYHNHKTQTITVMKKKRRTTELKERVLRNNLMQRFIREIEREEPLDSRTLQTMLITQPASNDR